jgi:hypothetical protein
MKIAGWTLRFAALLLLTSVAAAAQIDTVATDLKPLIRKAALSPVQFAVHVPHAVSAATMGRWTVTANRAEWRYAVHIPSAVSLSFHASHLTLPASAALTVQSATTTVTYRSSDIKKADFWSRIQPGDSLAFTLSVAVADRGAVALEILSFQAGYRSLGRGAQDNPYYHQIRRQAAAAANAAAAAATPAAGTANASCVQNYVCNITTANTPIGQATVGIVVGNQYSCTGTLINDIPGDNTPYVLTARHCETGELGGGNPAAAATVTVYWDATTPCGTTLGSIYDPAIATQTGATTLVEQQDTWLIKLDESPVVKDAQFAGFDASGAVVTGGYTVHHALGYDKQLTKWFGRAYLSQQHGTLGVTYLSQFLETVNQLGNIGPGASGSGLIDANNRLVGSLSLGRTTGDSSGYESCPSNPTTPNGSNGAADFTALASVWNSTADTSSSTHAVTLKSILDPANTGTKIVASIPAVNLNLSASTYSLADGSPLVLSWNGAGATQCTASGGVSGDGWSGTLAGSGSLTVTETVGGAFTYTLNCQLTGGRRIGSNVTVNWLGTSPFVSLEALAVAWTEAPATLTWNSNLTPCSISGGALALNNLASSGSTSTTQATPGDITYGIACGSAPTANSATTVSYVTPSLSFRANGTDRLIGEEFWLYWQSYANSCVPSGGAPNDGWTTTAFGPQGSFSPNVTTPGTYTYTLTCSAGSDSVSQSTTVTVESDAPYTTSTVTPATTTFTASPADYLTIAWKSNLSYCVVSSDPVTLDSPGTFPSWLPDGASDAEDSVILAPRAPGTYLVTVTCSSGVFGGHGSIASPPISVTVLPPPAPTATITSSAATVTVGQMFTLTWATTNAQNCVQTGNGPTVGLIWGNGSGADTGGGQSMAPNGVGQVTLGISCDSIDPNQPATHADTTVNVVSAQVAPTITFAITPTSVATGQSFSLTWSSNNAAYCSASGGGGASSNWTGPLDLSGSGTETAQTIGSFTYTITCSSGTLSSEAQATLTVTAPAPTTSAAAGSSHGGGAVDLIDLGALAALLMAPWARTRWRTLHRTA